jgi:WD40 repeat protein
MSERDIFTAALERTDPAERSAYLDLACAGDAALRQRVEMLLGNHVSTGDFLARPADEQMQADGAPAHDSTAALDAAGRPEQDSPRTESGNEEGDAPLDFLQPSTKPGSLGRLGHYEILEVLGRGGFGIVLKAFDEVLHRVVAVKVMAARMAAASPARKRFLREARAAAAVRHDNVVALHYVAEKPIPFLVMEFIAGETVQQRLDRSGPIEAAEVVRIGRQIAEGLAAAHAMGLIHRDVKPSNILLESGDDHVKITDFGLARAADDATVTQSGVITGTPMYMAPEQALGETIDLRADLFSLGSLLYAMCTGRPPFRASTTLGVLKRVAEDDAPPIRTIIPDAPESLCGIIAQLHAKKPEDRFASAKEVADVLARCLSDAPWQGGAPPGAGRAKSAIGRGKRRSWILAAVAVGFLATAVVATVVILRDRDGLGMNVRDNGKKDGAEPAAPWLPTPEELARHNPLDDRRRSDISPGLLALAGGGDAANAPAELVAVLARGPFTLPGGAMTHRPAVSPDGRWLAVASGNNAAVFDAATGALRTLLTGATKRLLLVAFSPDGKRIGAGSQDGKAYVWTTESGQLELTLEGHPDHVWAFAFSPDGKRIATACQDGSLYLWGADGQNKTPLAKQPKGLDCLAFSPDSKTLASAGRQWDVVLWDAAAGTEVRTLKGHTTTVSNLRYSADGNTLASGSDQETILWDPQTGQPRHTLKTSGAGLLAFTSESKTLLAARAGEEKGGNYLLTRWDAGSGQQTADVPLGPRRKGVDDLRFYAASPDGASLYACHPNGDDRVSVFDAATGKERIPAAAFHTGAVMAVAFSPDGNTLATGGGDHTIRLWDLAAWKQDEPLPPCRVLQGHTGDVYSAVFSPDSKFLASGGNDGVVILWDLATGEKLRDPFGLVGQSGSLGFSPDGKTVASPQDDGSVILYETGHAEHASWQLHKGRVRAAAFSPDGKLVASTGQDGTVSVFERAGGDRVHVFNVGAVVATVAFTRDGKNLVATTNEHSSGRLFVWNLASGKQLSCLTGPAQNVDFLALHPAGRLAAAASGDGAVRVWDLPTGRLRVFDFKPLGGRMTGVAFTPEGRYLATGSVSGIVRILKTPEFPALTEGAPAPGAIDLLKYAVPRKDGVKGIWTRRETDLAASGGQAVLELPYWPPAEYDILAEFTLDPLKHKGLDYAGIIFPYAGDRAGSVTWHLDEGGQLVQAVAQEPSRSYSFDTGIRFEPGKKYQFQVRVRKDKATVAINERETRMIWSADQKVRPGWQALRDNTLFGLICTTDTIYHRVEVVEVSGRGTFSRAR